jgi:hypothetical protein
LSKVAFAPGKVIHTNEFYKKNRRDKMEIRSYFDVAEELQQSIRSLKKQIELIHPSVPSSPNPYDTFVNQQSNLLKSLSQESFVIPQAVQDTPQQPNPIPLLEEEEAVAEGEDADSRFGAVEIRETYDQDGNVIDSQLVDLTSALKSSKSMLSESKASDESKDNAFADEMYEKLQQRLNLPTGQADDEGLLRDVGHHFLSASCPHLCLFSSLLISLKVNLFASLRKSHFNAPQSPNPALSLLLLLLQRMMMTISLIPWVD